MASDTTYTTRSTTRLAAAKHAEASISAYLQSPEVLNVLQQHVFPNLSCLDKARLRAVGCRDLRQLLNQSVRNIKLSPQADLPWTEKYVSADVFGRFPCFNALQLVLDSHIDQNIVVDLLLAPSSQADLKRVQEVGMYQDMSESGVTESGWDLLPTLLTLSIVSPDINTLVVRVDGNIHRAMLTCLQRFQRLTTLVLNVADCSGLNVETDEVVPNLGHLTCLTHLHLSGMEGCTTDFTSLSALTELKTLTLERISFCAPYGDDDGDGSNNSTTQILAVLRQLPQLANLTIMQCAGFYMNLDGLVGLSSLQKFAYVETHAEYLEREASDGQLNPAMLPRLTELTSLVSLELSVHRSAIDINQVALLPSLEFLVAFTLCPSPPPASTALARLSNLQHFELLDCSYSQEDDSAPPPATPRSTRRNEIHQQLGEQLGKLLPLPKLEHLELTNVSGQELQAIAVQTQLKVLRLINIEGIKNCYKHLNCLADFSGLRKLHLSIRAYTGTADQPVHDRLTDRHLSLILKQLPPSLVSLSLSQLWHVSQNGLGAIRNCPNLEHLSLADLNPDVQPSPFANTVIKALPHLKVLKVLRSHKFYSQTQPAAVPGGPKWKGIVRTALAATCSSAVQLLLLMDDRDVARRGPDLHRAGHMHHSNDDINMDGNVMGHLSDSDSMDDPDHSW